MKIVTNNVPRFTVDAFELTAKEREDFDYLDWRAIENGEDSATFFRYRGRVVDLGDMEHIGQGSINPFPGWHGHLSDSFFSGILVKFADDNFDSVVCATYYS